MECLNLIKLNKQELIKVAKKSLISYSNKNKSQLIEAILNEPERIRKIIIRDEARNKKNYDIMIATNRLRDEQLREDRPNIYKEPNLFSYTGSNAEKRKQLMKEQIKYDMKNYGMSPKELRKFKEYIQEYIDVLKKRIPNFGKTNTFLNIKSEYQKIINNNNESNENNNNKTNSQNLLIQVANLIKDNKINKNETIKKVVIPPIIKKPSVKKPIIKKPSVKKAVVKKQIIEESKSEDEDEEPIIIKPTMVMFNNDFNKYKIAMDKFNKITYELTKNEEKKLITKLNKLIDTIKKSNPMGYRKSRYKNVLEQQLREYENIEKGNKENPKKQILTNLILGVSKFNKKDLNLKNTEIEALFKFK
tara:strand:- start:916 stop:1998 length:1083 start_codon:yes stop_codon:yes gene_type:complete